jgi:hypothetical protein
MQTIQNHYKTIFICSVVIGLIFLAGLSIRPTQAQIRTAPNWLNQYEGKIIEVTFNSVPPGKDQIVKVRLDSVESTGIVVKYESPNAIFYTFSNIIAIDPL